MSVSDPLLKSLKSHVYNLCVSEGPITDEHASLQPFCQLLEVILRKGMKHSSSLMFELSRVPRDYWQWIAALSGSESGSGRRVRKLPLFDVVVQRCNTSTKVLSVQGRGRLFLREALQHRLLVNTIDLLADNHAVLLSYYDANLSILANEILREILRSLLMQINERTFQLCLKNHSFLDDTWKLPIYKQLQLVPCRELGVRLLHIDGRSIVSALAKGSIAEDSGKIEVGDVLDEIFDMSLRNAVVRGTIPKLLKKFYGQPVTLCVVKVMMRVSYTEVSSCGRKVDLGDYFAYIAGETTCTLAKEFTAHVFKAMTLDESKTIICAIAQGFSRTHWFV